MAASYSAHEELGREGRGRSRLLHLRNFNNWVKSVLINHYAVGVGGGVTSVLDLACGKGGDRGKWARAGVRRYCGVDIAGGSVVDGMARFNDEGRGGGGGMVGKLVVADLGASALEAAGVVAPGEVFDAVSIQFALHYLFANETRALVFFSNLARRLRPGGVFIGTIPDAAVLVRRLRDLPPGATEFGNDLYRVAFTREGAARATGALGGHPYGVEYKFYLAESVDDVPEYLVPWPLLVRLAAAAGLEPLASDNFHAFYAAMSRDPAHAALLSDMRVLNVEGRLTPAEWEVAGLYRVFAFRAPSSPAAIPRPLAPLPPLTDLLPPAAFRRIAPPDYDYKRRLAADDIIRLLQ